MIPEGVHRILARDDYYNEVLQKLCRDEVACSYAPALAKMYIDDKYPWGEHSDPFCNQLIVFCGRHGLKAYFGNTCFAKWNPKEERYDYIEERLIRIKDFVLGYQLDCVPTQENSIIIVTSIHTIGSTECKAVGGKGFYACKKFVEKLKDVFFKYGWPIDAIRDGIVQWLQGTVKGATQLATLSGGKTTSRMINNQVDWRDSTRSRWANLKQFKGQNRLCIFWQLMGLTYISNDDAGHPQLALINEQCLYRLNDDVAEKIKQNILQQQQLTHFKDYEKEQIS